MSERTPKRTVHQGDAIEWLRAQPVLDGCSFITSLPDVSEVPLDFGRWKEWFVDTTSRIIDRCPTDGIALFYQTDIKHDGKWVDKGYLCATGAERARADLLWHKIVCRREPGTTTFGRPAYAHMLCFSRGVRADPGRSTMDVLPTMGHMPWVRSMGVEACKFACQAVLDMTATRTVVDPFCGVGTVLAVANAMGMDAVGVELSRKRAEKAQRLRSDVLFR